MRQNILYFTVLILVGVFSGNCYEMYTERVRMHKESCKAQRRENFKIRSIGCIQKLQSDNTASKEDKSFDENFCLVILASISANCR
ncbi:MAG TPA: hypothetical protein PK453_24380 [Leptospiraceae bacterium]|nr:hypothetical protein [Leptospiraceae bacterium]HNF16814.1 hypothetical protein [Leptospiraceae bacterium]